MWVPVHGIDILTLSYALESARQTDKWLAAIEDDGPSARGDALVRDNASALRTIEGAARQLLKLDSAERADVFRALRRVTVDDEDFFAFVYNAKSDAIESHIREQREEEESAE